MFSRTTAQRDQWMNKQCPRGDQRLHDRVSSADTKGPFIGHATETSNSGFRNSYTASMVVYQVWLRTCELRSSIRSMIRVLIEHTQKWEPTNTNKYTKIRLYTHAELLHVSATFRDIKYKGCIYRLCMKLVYVYVNDVWSVCVCVCVCVCVWCVHRASVLHSQFLGRGVGN